MKIKRYLRDERKRPIGVLLMEELPDESIVMAISRCHPKDEVIKERGTTIAEGRLRAAKSVSPFSAQTILCPRGRSFARFGMFFVNQEAIRLFWTENSLLRLDQIGWEDLLLSTFDKVINSPALAI